MGKGLKEIVNSSARKVVLAGALAGTAVAGAGGCGALPGLPMYLNFGEKDDDRGYGVVDLEERGKYVGEYFDSSGRRYFHGKGTWFNKDGEIIRDGYWNMGNAVDKDPLEGVRKK